MNAIIKKCFSRIPFFFFFFFGIIKNHSYLPCPPLVANHPLGSCQPPPGPANHRLVPSTARHWPRPNLPLATIFHGPPLSLATTHCCLRRPSITIGYDSPPSQTKLMTFHRYRLLPTIVSKGPSPSQATVVLRGSQPSPMCAT
jgi:hypothetical protein